MHAALLLALAVTVLRDGVPVKRAEVCRFAAVDRENPFRRWLAAPDVTCVPAGGDVTFPAGAWNVFARSGNAVSVEPMLIDGAAPPNALSFSLRPAATIAVLLREGQRGVVYAPKHASAIPLDARGRATVPADEELWLFVIEKSVPVSVMTIARLEPGSEQTADARNAGPSSLIGWLQVPESDRAAIANARGLSSPAIRLGSRTADTLPSFDLMSGAFFRIREPSAGDGDLELAGRGWIPQRRRVTVSPALTAMTEPMTARASASLIVNWSSAGDLVALNRSIGSCNPGEKDAHYEISVASCAPPERPNGPVDLATCQVMRQETFPPGTTFGSFAVDDLVPGTYRVEMRFGTLPPVSAITNAPAARHTPVFVNARYFEIYGSLTRGGEPFGEDASIKLPGGLGFAPRDATDYRGAILSPLGTDAQITIAACDGSPSAVVLTDRPVRPGARFDIDIPDNELVINVTDTFTRMAIGGATVRYAVMSLSMPRRPVITGVALSDASDGRVRLTSIPERDLLIAVTAPGYQKHDVDPFSMTKSEKKTLDVQLVPLRGSRGRIVSARPFENAAILWYSSSGHEVERADLASDGTFIFAAAHEAGETMAVVSSSHPLWVLRAPSMTTRQNVEIRFPDAAARSFDVSLARADIRDTRYIGVMIGGVRVPQAVLRQHQMLRGLQAVVRGVGPLRIRDVAETGPIDVLLGPLTEEVSTRLGTMDLFALPQFANVPRQRLAPGANALTFQ